MNKSLTEVTPGRAGARRNPREMSQAHTRPSAPPLTSRRPAARPASLGAASCTASVRTCGVRARLGSSARRAVHGPASGLQRGAWCPGPPRVFSAARGARARHRRWCGRRLGGAPRGGPSKEEERGSVGRDETRPIGTEGGTRHVQLVRREGRDVSNWYGRGCAHRGAVPRERAEAAHRAEVPDPHCAVRPAREPALPPRARWYGIFEVNLNRKNKFQHFSV